jgi:hypothetical protein
LMDCQIDRKINMDVQQRMISKCTPLPFLL